MYKFLTQRGQMFALLLGVLLIAVYFIAVFSGLSSGGYSASDDLNSIMKNNPDADFSFFNTGITIAISLVVICAILWLIFAIVRVISSPKQSIKGIVTIIALVVLFIVLYSTSIHETTGYTATMIQKFDVSEGISKLISGGIKLTGLLGAVAVVIMVVSEIRNLFK